MSDQGLKDPTSSLKCKHPYLQFIARLRGKGVTHTTQIRLRLSALLVLCISVQFQLVIFLVLHNT